MLRLGSGTGSLTNHIDSRAVRGEPAPFVGMGATTLHWTDRHACTVTKVEVSRGVTYITVRHDKASRLDKNGMSESQTYLYEFDPTGSEYIFKKHPKTGFWKQAVFNLATNRYVQLKHGCGLRLGFRDEYYDYSF